MWCSDWRDGHGSFLDFDFENHKDHYEILELSCNASDDEIRSKFIRLALKWHPDQLKEGTLLHLGFKKSTRLIKKYKRGYTAPRQIVSLHRICRRNNLKKQDTIKYELLHTNKLVHSVRIHITHGG